jgi:hypothetical protein
MQEGADRCRRQAIFRSGQEVPNKRRRSLPLAVPGGGVIFLAGYGDFKDCVRHDVENRVKATSSGKPPILRQGRGNFEEGKARKGRKKEAQAWGQIIPYSHQTDMFRDSVPLLACKQCRAEVGNSVLLASK